MEEGGALADLDVTGLWRGEVAEEDTHQLVVQLHQIGPKVRGSVTIAFDLGDEVYLVVETVEGNVSGRKVSLQGTTCFFVPDDPDSDYSLDVFEMTAFGGGREMSGRWTDVDGDISGRVQLQRFGA